MGEITDMFKTMARENPIAIISEKDLKNNYISKEKIKTEIKNKMKNLWIDTCAEDSGKYTAYMSILNLLEEEN